MQYLKKHKLSLLVLFILTLTFSKSAYAYLDPGTGSVMLQGLLAGIVSGLAIVKIYWQRLKSFFMGIFTKKNSVEKNNDIPPSDQLK